MTISSARPDYLQRYAMLMTDRSGAARSASSRAAAALSTYRSSCPDLPVSTHAPALTDGALARSDGMLARVQRVAAAFTIADIISSHSDRRVVIVDDVQFGRFLPGTWRAAEGDEHEPEVLYRKGWRTTDDGTHTIGPADLKGDYEVYAGAEVTRTSFLALDRNGLDAAAEVTGFIGARAAADGSLEAGVVSGRAHVEASIGAQASLGANARISLDEVHAEAAGGVFVGGRASLDGEVEAMGVGLEGAAEVRYGAGADFSGEGHLGWDEVGFQFAGGFALGLGGGGSGGFTLRPKETVNDAVRLGARVPGDASKVARVARGEAEDLIDDGADLAGHAYRQGRDAFDDGLDFVRNPLGHTASWSPNLADIDVSGGR